MEIIYFEALKIITSTDVNSEEAKKEFFSRLSMSDYYYIWSFLSSKLTTRDAGRSKRRFQKEYGISVNDALEELHKCWELYSPNKKEGAEEFIDSINAGISLEEQAQTSQRFQMKTTDADMKSQTDSVQLPE